MFIIFLLLFPILGIFSKDYRILFRKSWECVFKKLTLKPCDINIGEEVKNKLLGKIVFKSPRFAKFIDKTASLWAFIFVVLSVWSLLYVANGALNLWVYDTCNPTSGESCALGGEACGVNTDTAPSLLETISRIPDRLKNWNAQEFTSENSSYYSFEENKKTAIEVIDPGCKFCKKLWGNIKESKFEQKYNLTYIAYPIPHKGGYKFPHSYMIVSYLEVLKGMPLSSDRTEVPTDWLLLDKIFTDVDKKNNTDIQNAINTIYTKDEVIVIINNYLREFGYTEDQIIQISELVNSETIKEIVEKNKNVVEEQIKTVKIPTIIFDGRRYDRVVDVDTLKK